MIDAMPLRMFLLAAGAGLLLHQAALGCRHRRPSLGGTIASAESALGLSCSADLPGAQTIPTHRGASWNR